MCLVHGRQWQEIIVGAAGDALNCRDALIFNIAVLNCEVVARSLEKDTVVNIRSNWQLIMIGQLLLRIVCSAATTDQKGQSHDT